MNDLISRQAVLDKKELVELEDGQSFYCISPEDVETLPSVNPQYTEVEGQKNEDAISRQAAIEIARSNIHYGLDKEYEYARELLQKTMAEISSLPPVNPQPYEDAISRQAVNNLQKYRYNCGDTSITCISLKSVNDLPPVIPQPKTGHWIFDEILDKHYYCSECKSMGVDYWDYCPNCGSYNGGD